MPLSQYFDNLCPLKILHMNQSEGENSVWMKWSDPWLRSQKCAQVPCIFSSLLSYILFNLLHSVKYKAAVLYFVTFKNWCVVLCCTFMCTVGEQHTHLDCDLRISHKQAQAVSQSASQCVCVSSHLLIRKNCSLFFFFFPALVSKSRRAMGSLCSSHIQTQSRHVHTPSHIHTYAGNTHIYSRKKEPVIKSSSHWLAAKRNVLRRTLIHFKLQRYWKPVTTAKYWYGVISQLWRGYSCWMIRGEEQRAEVDEQEVSEVVQEEEVTTEKIMVLASGGWNCTPNLLR